ncbi:DNA primase [Legionella jamestowniensis]|uniref:DNA primase n=1 Tax=Legionella jamestowniensis TaxID=455 RepID=A0A0W0UKL8_9GAMM|nr:DNA primase [Legionella jamestowniensis]KTD08404.1 DNA primase DnaG [Legionella jamestowniensis]SFL50617.1 DNA primase [Legionella jamestowniensis DSM 19215]
MTGLIPQPFIDELLTRTDIVELIDSYIPLKKSGQAFVACCPFHSEKTPSFNVIAKKQFYHCFGCGASGNVISFVMNYLNQGFTDAIETLASRLGLQVPREGRTEKNQHSLSLYQLLEQVSQFYQQTLKTQGQQAITYLRQRGLTGEIAKRYQLGYAISDWQILEKQFRGHRAELITTGMLIQKEDGKTYDRYRHRIMFPIHDRHGRIIGFGGRAIDAQQKPKYLNSPETVIFQKSRELYGLHQVLQTQKTINCIIIVEGYLDVIALAQHGIGNAVATLGTATSTYHIQLLTKHTQHLIFCFDGDTAGRQAAWRALESCLPQLNIGLNASFIFLPEGQDPDSLVREEGATQFLERLQQAKPLNQFFFETLSRNIDLASVAGKSQLVNVTKPHLLKMQEGPYKQLLLDELARITHIESHRLEQLLRDKAPQLKTSHKPITRSPIRLAIALLIQHPEIFNECKHAIDPALLDGKDQELLQKLLQQIAKTPEVNTATLIEQWRNTPYFEALIKLASWEHQVPEVALVKEFVDIILFLQKQNLENKINQYIAKSRNQGLTLSERLNLQEMLKQRHQTVDDKK